MFDDVSKPAKGKGKEKDIGKRRAYVRVVTSLGGSLNLELFCEKVRSYQQLILIATIDICERPQKHATTSSCSHERESTIIACSTDWCPGSW